MERSHGTVNGEESGRAQTYLVAGIRHCVKRSDGQGVFVQHVEVSVILKRAQKRQIDKMFMCNK